MKATREAMQQSWDTALGSRVTVSEGCGLPPQHAEGRGQGTIRRSPRPAVFVGNHLSGNGEEISEW